MIVAIVSGGVEAQLGGVTMLAEHNRAAANIHDEWVCSTPHT